MNEQSTSSTGSNGASTLHDLFALTDEQILEIEPEPQNVEVAPRSANPNASASQRTSATLQHITEGVIPSEPAAGESRDRGNISESFTQQGVRRDFSVATLSQNDNGSGIAQDAGAPHLNRTADAAPVTTHQSPVTVTPPQWLAERMADPQLGAEARELWTGVQQARQEAAAFREVFAKPEDALAARQRARLLDDIDRAYFAGDATQRAQLAASMLREDPAAFREMVFAGLRALEQANVAPPFRAASPGPSSPDAGGPQPAAANASVVEAVTGTQHIAPLPGNAPNASAVGARHAVPAPGAQTADAHLAAYAAFERAANADLERSVGAAIERTLAQALPAAQPLVAVRGGGEAQARGPALQQRLASSIRIEVEKALQGDRQLGEQVAQILAAGRTGASGAQTFRFDDQARAQVVRLIGERAQQLVPTATKRVLNEWTQTTLASHRDRISRTDTASSRRELEPASSATGSATSSTSRGSSPGSPRADAAASAAHRSAQQNAQRRPEASAAKNARGVDYRKLSDEQILDL